MNAPGNVFLNPNYTLPNGEKHESYFIILKPPDLANPALCAMTTSQSWRDRDTTRGCHKKTKVYSIPQSWHNVFSCDSWIVMPIIFSISLHDILTFRDKKDWIYRGRIDEECLNEIIECYKNYQDDIDTDYARRLFCE